MTTGFSVCDYCEREIGNHSDLFDAVYYGHCACQKRRDDIIEKNRDAFQAKQIYGLIGTAAWRLINGAALLALLYCIIHVPTH